MSNQPSTPTTARSGRGNVQRPTRLAGSIRTETTVVREQNPRSRPTRAENTRSGVGLQQPRAGVRSAPRQAPQTIQSARGRGRPRAAGRTPTPSTTQNVTPTVQHSPSPLVQPQLICTHVDPSAAQPMTPSQEPINYSRPVSPQARVSPQQQLAQLSPQQQLEQLSPQQQLAQPPPQEYSPVQRPIPSYRVSSRTIISEYMRTQPQRKPSPAKGAKPKASESSKERQTERMSSSEMDARMLAYLIFCDEGRKTADEIFKEVIDTKSSIPTKIQIRGSKPPPWFPGYFHLLTSSGDVAVEADPQDVMQKAWKARM